MAENLDRCRLRFPPPEVPDGPGQLRRQLAGFARAAAAGRLVVHLPRPAPDLVARGDGHFHLAPELFLQVAGQTLFRLPHEEVLLRAGEALVMPAKLLHDEAVSAAGPAPEQAFGNLVIYADSQALSCHLAHEAEPGVPGILHLEARRHPQAARIHDWLQDAVSLGRTGDNPADRDWAQAQRRAMVSAAVVGVLRALDDAAGAQAPPEPPLVARVRVLIQNQLGDHTLGVRRLAAQCGCTADYLSHVFSRQTGERLAACINRLRMARAVHLLEDGEMAIKEVAWACGFAAPGYFIRTFRAHQGVTPAAWRRLRSEGGALPAVGAAGLSGGPAGAGARSALGGDHLVEFLAAWGADLLRPAEDLAALEHGLGPVLAAEQARHRAAHEGPLAAEG